MDTPDTPTTAISAPASRPGMGIFWMLVTGICFVTVTASVKMVGEAVPSTQAGFLRYALGLIFLIPMLPAVRRVRIGWPLGGLFLARGTAHAVAVSLWFFAMARIPIADVTALNYLNPVYVILLAVVFLGERLGPWRIAAVAIAFLGTFVIIRPGFREIDTGHIVMLFAAVAMAASYFLAKLLSQRVAAEVVVFYLSIIVPVVLLPFVLPVWVPVGWVDLGWLFVCAAFATAGHYTMTLAFRSAPLTVTQPVAFLQLVWATLLGVLVFSEPVDGFVLLGGGMIIAAVSFITWREAMRGRSPGPAELPKLP